jgi:proline racemase
VVLTGPPTRPEADLRSITVYRDGTIDRSPSGAGTAAVLALLDAMGLVSEGQVLGHEGVCGGVFRARVHERVAGDPRGAVVPEISGEAWITGEHTFLLDPEDPFREGIAT